MKPKINVCPLCDEHAAQYQYWEDEDDHVVACLLCGCNITAPSRRHVIDAWNCRPEEERLRKALLEIANEKEIHTKLNQERLCCKFQSIAMEALRID